MSDTAGPSGTFSAQSPPAIRQQNVAATVRTVLAHGPIARKEIARLTGLSAGSVSRVTANLVRAGLLSELPSESMPGNAGAPRVPLDFARERYAVLGVHIGALATTIGLVDVRGADIVNERYYHEHTESSEVLSAAARHINDFADRYAEERHLLGVGVTLAGWIDSESGVVIEHDTLGWRDVPVRADLARRTELPVLVESSVRARALAELWSGAATRVRSLVYLFIGTVVDAAIVIDRSVHYGPRSAAGTLAHLQLDEHGAECDCGRRGCAHAYITDLAAVRHAQQRGVADVLTIQALVARAHDGDETAQAVLLERAEKVGELAAILLDMIDPDIVVFSDNAVTDTLGYLSAVRRGAANRAHAATDAEQLIVPTSFAEQAIVIAPAMRVLDAFYEDPMAFLTDTAAETSG